MFFELEKDHKYPEVWYNDNEEYDPFVTVICPQHAGHQRGRRDFNISLWIDIKKPKLGDFISTVYSDWLITDRVAEIFSSYKLSGYRLQSVKVCNKKLDFNLWELVITSSVGKAHRDAGIKLKDYCEYCGAVKYTPIKKGVGIIVDEENWDGSDFFTITEYWKYVLVTERVKKIIVENNLKGVVLVKLNEIGWDE